MADELTDRQRQVLELFVDAARDLKPAPTYREVAHELDFTSVHAAWCHVKALVAKGWLERHPRAARSLALTSHARRLYGLRGAA